MSGSTEARHSDEEYVDAVREREPAATSEVAAAVGVSRQSADYRLRKLEADGRVEGERIGNSLAWRLADRRAALRNVDPEDEFWEVEAYEGAAMSASDADDVVYGETE